MARKSPWPRGSSKRSTPRPRPTSLTPAYLTENRLFLRVAAEGALARDAERLAREVDGLRILGLPVRTLTSESAQHASAPAVLLNVVLTASQSGETRVAIVLSQADGDGRWTPLGKTSFREGSAASVLDGEGLARVVDRSVASAFVTVKTARKSSNLTLLRVENRLPFTLSKVSLRAGNSSGAPSIAFPGLGIAPARSTLVPVQAASASVDRVDLNGL